MAGAADFEAAKHGRVFSFADVLAPYSVSDFLNNHYEKAPLWIRRGDPRYFEPLITLEDVDHHLTHVGHHFPDVAVANALDDIPSAEYTFPDGRIDKSRIYNLFSQGCTIVMRRMHMTVPALARLCRSAEKFFQCEFQTNVYFTPPGDSQGFKIHYDTHEIFALQVLGSKRWRTYGTPVELPLAGQDYDRANVDPGPVSNDFKLQAGDVYYFPRGLVHDAVTTDEPSIHVTLGMLSQTWTELMVEAMLSVCHENAAFRRNLPIGALGARADKAAMEAAFREMVAAFAEKATLDGALDRFGDGFVNSRQPLNWGRSRDLLRIGTLTAESVLGVRPELIHRLSEIDGRVVLHVHTSEISFPAAVRPALEFALATERFAVGAIPGLSDDASRLTLARRLVGEGVLTFV